MGVKMNYDVIIVGAGPAGSTTANFLSKRGFKVLLLDKDKFPRDKPCGGGLPFRVLKRFNYLDDEKFVESYSYGGIVHSPSLKYKVEFQNCEPIVAMTLRKKFDFELVKVAIENGANFSDGKAVINVDISKDEAKIFLDDGNVVNTELVVGADGVWSIIAKKTGLSQKGQKGLCVLQEYEVDKETLDRYFGENRYCHIHTRFQNIMGYGWVFPKKEHLNIGIGEITIKKNKSDIKRNLSKVFQDYVKMLKRSEIIPDNLKEKKCKGGALPVYPLEKTYTNRVVLVGDAGGFVNPLSGEGIYYAMTSGEIAAKVITKSLESGETSERFLSKYQINWKKDIGEDLDFLCRLAKNQRQKPREKLFRIASKDKMLGELILKVVAGDLSPKENKWKIIRRYIYGSIKEEFKKML